MRYIGVTHYTASAQNAVARIVETQPLDFIQINYSVGERDAERRLLPLARERGVAVIANRPFVEGALFSRLRGRPLPEWAAEIGCESWAQVLLKFVISYPATTCAIPLRAHASDYGYDPNRIGVIGESAGGHLVAMLGTTNGDKTFGVGDHRGRGRAQPVFRSDLQR